MEIYNMLKYDKSNEYILNSSKILDEEINGKDQEIKRLYNYTYDLLSQIINAVNDENKRIAKEEKELSKKSQIPKLDTNGKKLSYFKKL